MERLLSLILDLDICHPANMGSYMRLGILLCGVLRKLLKPDHAVSPLAGISRQHLRLELYT
jgi:hypothetical protein